MKQPQGFKVENKNLVCKLHKSLYGLKQAPRAWFSKLSQAPISFGFMSSKSDHSLFIKRFNGRVFYVLVYVDDILIIGTSALDVRNLISKLHSTFSLKDLGSLDYFLGIKVTANADGSYILSQEKTNLKYADKWKGKIIKYCEFMEGLSWIKYELNINFLGRILILVYYFCLKVNFGPLSFKKFKWIHYLCNLVQISK